MIVVFAILPHFVPVNSPLSDLTLMTLVGLIGLYYLYSGVKKFRQRKAQQPQVRWYSQPAILVAIGMFFFVFVSLFLWTLLATGREENLTSTQGKGIRGT